MDAVMTLVQAAKAGDDVAFEVLLEPVLQPGYRLACCMLQDPPAAEDAVQEAALKVWRKLGGLRDGTDMRPWFLGIVANECRSVRRGRWWSVLKMLPERPVEGPAEGIVAGMELRRNLRLLDHGMRLVIVLHWYLDLPVTEIAAITGLTPHAVESRLQRGVNELRKRMEVDGG